MEKFEVELKIIKSKIHEEDLQEDFINKLENKLNEKYNNMNADNNKVRFLRKPIFVCKSVAAVFVCFLLLSSCTFADEIEDWIKSIFSSVSPTSEIAYEEGNLIKVDSEYQTFDNISANIDYVSITDNELYIVFNIQTENSFDKIYLEGLKLEGENGEIKYLHDSYDVNRETTKDCKLIAKLPLKNKNDSNIRSFNIAFKSIVLEKGNENKKNNGNWMFELNLDNKKD